MTAHSTRLASSAGAEPAPSRPRLPYGRQLIEADDVAAVVSALTSDHLAHGPRVTAFETEFALRVGAAEAVACSSGTAALHLALAALDIGEGDVCVAPSLTFLATASAVRFCGAEVMFADVDPDTGLMTPDTLGEALARAPRKVAAVLPVHLAGRLCAMSAISRLARDAGAAVVEDACHAVGGRDAEGQAVGRCTHAEAAAFSFHPVKTLAAGEGGMVTLNCPDRADRMRRMRNHGVTRDPCRMSEPLSFDPAGAPNPWSYEQLELGFNYRMNEMEAALGLSQLAKLDRFVARRATLAALYDAALRPLSALVRPTPSPSTDQPGLHLYTVLIDFDQASVGRAELMRRLEAGGISTQVHYIPIHRQPYFKARYGEQSLPGADAYFSRVLALPLFPAMEDGDVERVASALASALGVSDRATGRRPAEALQVGA